MQLTVDQANARVLELENDISQKEDKIQELVADMSKSVTKGNLDKVRQLNVRLKGHFEFLDEMKEWLEKARLGVIRAERIEKGYGPFIEFLEEMLQEDIKWHQNLKKDYEEKGYNHYLDLLKKKEITKSTIEFARMREEDALKVFRSDSEARFYRLSKQLADKVGAIEEVDLKRNPNGGFDGRVAGEKGTVYIDTIIAGGYNIQRAHYRTIFR